MIYIVEDDDSIRELVVYTLSASGLEAEGFTDAEPFWKAMSTTTPDLVMLDIMLPGEDGISILKKLRKNSNTADLPIIMATAKGTEYDKVIGLDTGADDYLAKPFGMMEMVSRVKALLRRTTKHSTANVYTIGELAINTLEHKVFVNRKSVELTLKEYELLLLFAKNIGRVFTREQLLNSIWGTDFIGETRTVDVHIGTLRTKLATAGDYIKTVRGVGYKLEEQ